jgi:hypothetical protein
MLTLCPGSLNATRWSGFIDGVSKWRAFVWKQRALPELVSCDFEEGRMLIRLEPTTTSSTDRCSFLA